ncbi:GumC family protein [Formosa sp. S-31]|uniref:GumC family protein n=1 Tax=Formosa sp. S-31 TaxID=2790949 RepID=UPI003EB950AC
MNKKYKEEDINLNKYLLVLKKHKNLFLIFFIMALVLSILLMNKNNYYTYATLLYNQNNQTDDIATIFQQFKQNTPINTKKIETELIVLNSLHLTKKALERLSVDVSYFKEEIFDDKELYEESPFQIKLAPEHTQLHNEPIFVREINDISCRIHIQNPIKTDTIIRFNEWLINDRFAFKIIKEDSNSSLSSGSFYFVINNLNQLASDYQKKLKVSLANEDADIINLGFSGNIAKRNVDFLNKLMDVYIEVDLNNQNITAHNTINFIDAQLAKVVDSLKIAEGALQSFRQDNKIVDLGKEGYVYLEKLNTLEKDKSELEIKLKYYSNILNYINKSDQVNKTISPPGANINDPLLNKLIKDLNDAYNEKTMISRSVSPQNPRLIQLNTTIQANIDSIKEFVTNIIESSITEMQYIDNQIYQINGRISEMPTTELQMVGFERKFELNDKIYNFLLQKKAEVSIAGASTVPNIRIIDHASQQTTSSSLFNKLLSLIVPVSLALFIPCIFLIGKEAISSKITNLKEIELLTTLPIIGLIPKSSNKKNNLLVPNDSTNTLEAFRRLRSEVFKILKYKSPKVIEVSSCVSGENKTYCCINLTTTIAQANKKALLLDLDFRKPELTKTLGYTNNNGIINYLRDGKNLSQLIVKTKYENVDFIPIGNNTTLINEDIEALFLLPQMDELISNFKNTYEYIIIETAPIALFSDSQNLEKNIDYKIIVLRQNYSLKNNLQILNNFKKNTGLVITEVDNYSGIDYRKFLNGFKLKKEFTQDYLI